MELFAISVDEFQAWVIITQSSILNKTWIRRCSCTHYFMIKICFTRWKHHKSALTIKEKRAGSFFSLSTALLLSYFLHAGSLLSKSVDNLCFIRPVLGSPSVSILAIYLMVFGQHIEFGKVQSTRALWTKMSFDWPPDFLWTLTRI